jgi:argininosuccinate lyase
VRYDASAHDPRAPEWSERLVTLWSGRFDGAPDPAAFDFGISFGFDRALFEDDVTGSLAWAEALGQAGVLSAADVAAIVGALDAILAEGRQNPGFVTGPDEDVHSFVERQLVDRIGDAGRRLHTGRSRNEQVSLDLRLYLRRRIPLLASSVADLISACADLAERAGDALMPSYTHMRRAQPVLVAHFFLAHAAALRRDHDRLGVAAHEADALTLGSGAVAGTSYPVDTARLASRLGFSRVVLNSLDASSDRDFVASFLYAVSLAMVHLSRLSEDFIIFTGEEHGFFELSDASATGSSMMPQKKNPDPLELVRGKAGRAIGRLTGWLVTMKGLPSGYNKDLQEDKEAVFDAERTLSVSLVAAQAVVSRLSVHAERATQAASGLLLATDVADYLTSRGMPFRRAHEVVGAMVRRLLGEGRDFSTLTIAEWRDASELFGDDAPEAATALASVRAKRTPQSTNPAAVAAALAECRAWVAASGHGEARSGGA